jgi:LysR family transcriptional regulator, cyn operon transcriptional activator
MELRHLRYFVSVAEAASVSKAASRINVSQPALSRQIRDLETELGVRLFDRVGRRIRLTAEGEDLLERSRDVLARAASLGERAGALSGGAVGTLRVGATPQTMQSVVAGFLTRYRRSRPGVQVHLTEAGGVRLLDLVGRGELHLTVCGILPGERLAYRLLFPFRVLAVAAAGTRLRRRSTIDIRELAGEPLLLLSRDFGTRQLFDAACRIAQFRPRVVLESAAPDSLITLAGTGHGIAVVPSTVHFVSRKIRAAPIVQDGKSLGWWAAVAWDSRRSLPRYSEAFIEGLAAYTRHRFPGKQFERVAPAVPRPPHQETAPGSRSR